MSSQNWRQQTITTEPKTFHLDLPKYGGISLRHEIDFILKHN